LARRAGRPLRRAEESTRPRVAAVGGRPEITEGVRAAYGGRGSGLVVASAAVAAITFLTIVVFAGSLSALISTPAGYGWTWDLAVIGNVGYGPLDLDAVEETLDEHDEVAGWTALSFNNSVGLNGELLLSMIRFDGDAADDVTVIEGEPPSGDDEVALGLRTAVERGIDVGDVVEVGMADVETRRVTVSGLVVFPALGPFLSDRATPGTGMLLPSDLFGEGEELSIDMGFVGIKLVDGADPQAVRAALGDDVARWDLSGDGLIEYDAPIRPPEIDDARSIRTLPAVVGGLVVLATTVGLSFAVVVSVRSRRRELAILRAIGFTDRQVRSSVRVQTVAIMIAALVLGVPLGVVAGRLAWRAFASQLGVVPDPSTPGLWVLVTVAGGLVVALLAAAVPARVAARASPAAGLRSE
jgi:FtsX-like permease family